MKIALAAITFADDARLGRNGSSKELTSKMIAQSDLRRVFRRKDGDIRIIGKFVEGVGGGRTGRFPNPTEGNITQKDDSGNFALKTEQGIIQISAGDILSITRLKA
jgi:hypothetical protein